MLVHLHVHNAPAPHTVITVDGDSGDLIYVVITVCGAVADAYNITGLFYNCNLKAERLSPLRTRKPSCRWQTRATRKHAQNCSNSTCFVSFHRIPFAKFQIADA